MTDIEKMILWYQINNFYSRESRALDEEDYEQWFSMLAEDIHYWMPSRETLFRKDEQEDDARRMNFYNETFQTLQLRVARLKSGSAWSENPRTRYRHFVSNIEVEVGNGGADKEKDKDKDGEIFVRSNTIVYRNRLEREEYWLIAKREDILRKTGDSFKIAKRKISVDFSSLLSKNLNVFL